MKKIYWFFIFFLILGQVLAQEPAPNQFGSAHVALNPAFTGTSVSGRGNFLYRVQYPRLSGALVSTLSSYDHNFDDTRSSLGIVLQSDRIAAGTGGNFRSIQANAIYAYMLPTGDFWRVKMALSVGYGNKSLNYLNLVYGDQFSPTGLTGQPTQDNTLLGQSIDYLDVSTGILAYNEYAWIGFSAAHLNQPERDFLGTPFKVPLRLSGHLGIRIPLCETEKSFISPVLLYRGQSGLHLLDAGLFFETENFQTGVLYRNLPIQTQSSQINFQAGFRYEGFRCVYSYGMPLGGLGGIGGGHEMGISFAIQREPTERRWAYTRCPVF